MDNTSLNFNEIDLNAIMWLENTDDNNYQLVPFIRIGESGLNFINLLTNEQIDAQRLTVLEALALSAGAYDSRFAKLKTSHTIFYENYIKCRNLDLMRKVRRCVATAIMQRDGTDFNSHTYFAIKDFCNRKQVSKKDLAKLVNEITTIKNKEKQNGQECEK